MFYKVLFMEEQNLPTESLQEIKDIRRLMDRSSRFISLSGLSGIAAGICALAGALVVTQVDRNFMNISEETAQSGRAGESVMKIMTLTWIGIIVFIAAFVLAFFFTWQRSKKTGVPVWGSTSKRLLFNTAIPMLVGGVVIFRLIELELITLIAPACLIFYGLALLNGSKYTLGEVRYLGYCQIILGLINLWVPGYGLYFWAVGFGILHIIYGAIMWFKYERK